MSHRTQIPLTDSQYARLEREKVEVLAGMRPGEEEATRQLLALLEWIQVDDTLAEKAGEPTRQHLPSYPGVDPVDFVIAATVQQLGA